MNEIQTSFVEGLDTISPSDSIDPNGYEWVINGRTRFGAIDPIKQHEEDLNIPSGLKQGLVSLGDLLFCFVSGKAYYKKLNDSYWFEVGAFIMSTTQNRFWTQTVPESTMNLQRKTSGTDAGATIIKQIDVTVSGTPSGLLVQDGINQPWIIFYENGAVYARETKKYGAWSNVSLTLDDREYVPIGTSMMLINGILFIKATDNKSFYRSVTGRPLDFVIAVDASGNKIGDEREGGAYALSVAFDYDDITCLFPINVPDSFIYATSSLVRIITLDYDNTLYGEPTFRESARIQSGIVNDESFIEVLGDYVFIDKESIISFNAAQQLNSEAKNSIFSLPISRFVNKIKQNDSRCIMFDNYCLFSIYTIWGYAVLIYDILRSKWVSVDINDVTRVKQFARIELDDEVRLYALNYDGRVFRMFAKDDTYTAQVMTRGFSPEDVSVEHKTQYVKPKFTGGVVAGYAEVIEYVDGQRGSNGIVQQDLPANLGGVEYPVTPPVGPSNVSITDIPGFIFANSLTGKTISYVISWNTSASLEKLQVVTNEIQSSASQKQKSLTYAS